jgi:protein-tyrosine phosphatase
MKNLPYRFAAASPDDRLVFGAAQPDRDPQPWFDFMQQQQIQRVCCLLEDKALQKYPDRRRQYHQQFGENNVLWAPIADFTIAPIALVTQQILPFLADAIAHQQKVVVHCAGGLGRTGHILACWLVYQYDLRNQDAIATITATGRKPQEAIRYACLLGRQPRQVSDQLDRLLDTCRNLSHSRDPKSASP